MPTWGWISSGVLVSGVYVLTFTMAAAARRADDAAERATVDRLRERQQVLTDSLSG